MNISKIGANRYRVREMKNGKTFSINFDHRPTKNEAREALDEMMRLEPITASRHGMTFSEAYNGFCDAKSSILSPSTLKGYRTAYRGLPAWFCDMSLAKIDRTHVQKVVNDFSVDHAPKTVKNQYGLISAVMNFYGCRECPVTLPQAVRSSAYIPSKEDVHKLLKVASGTRYEVPLRLGMYGLRRSEILGLDITDLSDNNVLTINKALVEGIGGSVVKTTKTTNSTRSIVIDKELADLIRQQGFIYQGSASRLSMAIAAYEQAAGLPHFSLHKLRHFYASYLHSLGYSDQVVQESGGWASSGYVMKNVYRHAMDMDEAQTEIAQDLGEIFSGEGFGCDGDDEEDYFLRIVPMPAASGQDK